MKRLTVLLILLVGLVLPGESGGYLSGFTNCPSSGNAQVSTVSYFLKGLTVTANQSNTGVVYLGGASVVVSSGTPLVPLASASDTDNTASINPATEYFACTVSGDGITWRGRQ